MWERTIDINLHGPFYGMRTAIPAMEASGEPCAIVNIGSMIALRTASFVAANSASKTTAPVDTLMQTTFEGEATGFTQSQWGKTTVPIVYRRYIGAGRIVYNALGHCRGHYDLAGMADFYPHKEMCAWNYDVSYDLWRRTIRWAMRDGA